VLGLARPTPRAYGSNNPPTAAAKELSDQRRCQKKRSVRGVADFVKKLGYTS
jgi:hypothetical protein